MDWTFLKENPMGKKSSAHSDNGSWADFMVKQYTIFLAL